ncbi:uncharacterized protein LOC105423722 [Pogonomyrmex barbatus]|uniref:Uncharacterized protein LOC105423722 n=1 Tax=Pogonomyrmex barbatus TaxID=144034 RepID=A0A6I9VXQ9_9HYME|nr:uncharacterized protein LOC105423722 [Pogonomyrmex barbatus]
MEGRATNWAIFNMPVMTVLLVDSYQQQSLERQLQEITIKSTINPYDIERKIARLNDQTIIAMKILDDISFIKGNFQLNATTRFGRLIDQQQRLKTVGIAIQELLDSLISHSHRTLRNISLIAQKHNMFAKCTDIGDSRYAYILCAMYVSKQIMAISSDLEVAGFGVTKTTFSKVGLKIETGLDF